jgi:uncharacterized membrane-anchored protein YhcB (DUF1043 family)
VAEATELAAGTAVRRVADAKAARESKLFQAKSDAFVKADELLQKFEDQDKVLRAQLETTATGFNKSAKSLKKSAKDYAEIQEFLHNTKTSVPEHYGEKELAFLQKRIEAGGALGTQAKSMLDIIVQQKQAESEGQKRKEEITK